MRVLHITPTLSSGGAERMVVELVKQFHGRIDQQVALLYPVQSEGQLFFKPELDQLNIPIRYLDKHPGKWARIATAWRYWQVIRDFQPDIIHAHQWHPMDVSRAFHRFFRGHRLVVTPHNIMLTKQRIHMEQRLSHYTDLVLVISNGVAAEYRMYITDSENRLTIIPNGIDTRKFTNGQRSPAREHLGLPVGKLGLLVGRIHPQKNLLGLAQAVHHLVKAGRWQPEATIICVGRQEDSDYTQKLTAYIQQEKLPIRLIGQTDDVLTYYHACDFLLLPSQHEGLPLVVLEAAAAGRPALVSEAANMDEIVIPNETGWVVPTNDVDALANTLAAVFEMSAEERDHMGMATRAHIQANFDIRQIAQRYLDVYSELVNRPL